MLDIKHPFPGKDDEEAVFIFVRPYFIAFIPVALLFTCLFLGSVGLQLGLRFGLIAPTLSPPLTNLLVLGLGLFELITLIFFLIAIMDFYYDILIVTDRRLVDIDQSHVFHRNIAELLLEDVQDVNASVTGFFATVFRFGRVVIQTAGAKPVFESHYLRRPREVAAIITDLTRQAKSGRDVHKRKPDTVALAVINDRVVTSIDELVALGGIEPADPRTAPETPADATQ